MFRKLKFAAVCLATCLRTTTVYASEVYTVPKNNAFKAYMDWRTITDKSSAQYRLQQWCITNDTGIRTYNGRYAVAVGTAFNAPVGTYLDVHLVSGTVLACVVGDIKQNCHTDYTNMQVASNGNIVEFIVDERYLSSNTKKHGDISMNSIFDGEIGYIVKYLPSDMSSIDFEMCSFDTSGDTYVRITDKYKAGDFYFIEYCSNSVFNTINITAEEYEKYTIGESYIRLP